MITWFVIVVETHLTNDTHELVAPSNGDADEGAVAPVGSVGELEELSDIGNINDAGARPLAGRDASAAQAGEAEQLPAPEAPDIH